MHLIAQQRQPRNRYKQGVLKTFRTPIFATDDHETNNNVHRHSSPTEILFFCRPAFKQRETLKQYRTYVIQKILRGDNRKNSIK